MGRRHAWAFTGASASGPVGVPVITGSPNYDQVYTGGGGQRVVVPVEDSTGCTAIKAGGVAFTSFAIDNGTHVSGIPGPHAAGVVDLVVSNGAGDSTTGGGLIEYWSPALLSPRTWGRGENYDPGMGTMTDEGALADDFTQLVADAKPTAGSVGGRGTLVCDGTDDFVHTANHWDVIVGDSLFLWCLFYGGTPSVRNAFYDGNLIGDAGNAEIGLDFSADGLGMTVLENAASYIHSPPIACAPGDWHLALGMVDAADIGNEGKLALDDGAWTEFAVSGGYGAAAPGQVSLGVGYTPRYLAGQIAEAGVVDGTVSAPDVVKLRKYARQLYGVTV